MKAIKVCRSRISRKKGVFTGRNDLRDPVRRLFDFAIWRTRRATLRIYLVIQFPRPVAIITDRGAEPWRITAPCPAIFLLSFTAQVIPLRVPSPPTTALLFFQLSFSPSTQLLLFLRLSSLLSPFPPLFYPHFVPLTCFFSVPRPHSRLYLHSRSLLFFLSSFLLLPFTSLFNILVFATFCFFFLLVQFLHLILSLSLSPVLFDPVFVS